VTGTGLHDLAAMSGREYRTYRTWRAAHHGKRRYQRRRLAWAAVFRFWVAHRYLDWDLRPYQCCWGPDWRQGAVLSAHYHIGHGRRIRSPWYWCNRFAVWPYYRMRLTVRIAAGRAQAPPDWLPPGIYWARRTYRRWRRHHRNSA
jgi:hypothetical protein